MDKINKIYTIERLSSEKGYEDKLALELNNFLLTQLDKIKDISDSERQIIRKHIYTIIIESTIHSSIFGTLLGMVSENEKNEY